jgi:hypothetical protein
MKQIGLKIFSAVFAFFLGILGIWTINDFSLVSVFFSEPSFVTVFENEKSIVPPINSSRVEIRFKRFYKNDGSNIAEFELYNGLSEPVRYLGYSNSKDSYCGITFKRQRKLIEATQCSCGTGLDLQVLNPGETAIYSLSDSFARRFLESQHQPITTSLGFEVLIGKDQTTHTVWTEEISFPE